ncbi:G-type lectin S-receptor-like serine/threonine-protein kinase RKS1-like protein [Glycine soja]|nr:G-type lectin S-receptor-like serine/threonine-protein kinase RKS1-like protein [Glycine soja]
MLRLRDSSPITTTHLRPILLPLGSHPHPCGGTLTGGQRSPLLPHLPLLLHLLWQGKPLPKSTIPLRSAAAASAATWVIGLGGTNLYCVSVYIAFEGLRLSSFHKFQPMMPLITILQSTDNFSEASKLGERGFGPVYKGILPDRRQIAVKRLSKVFGQGSAEFNNEVTFIAKLQHRNLVRLLACCLEENEKILVYEYLTDMSLDFHLLHRLKYTHFDCSIIT